jgi:hypothetical protein
MKIYPDRSHVIGGLIVLGLLGSLTLNAACGAGGSAPEFTETGRSGVTRMVVVRPDQLSDDAELWRVADHLQSEEDVDELQVIFWTDEALAGRGVPMTYEQVDAEKAQINIDRAIGRRDLQRY